MACCLFISNLCPELLAPAAGGVGGGSPPCTWRAPTLLFFRHLRLRCLSAEGGGVSTLRCRQGSQVAQIVEK